MQKVFIAGGTGMLGAATARALAARGIEVVVSSRKATDPVGDQLTAESELIRVAQVALLDGTAVTALLDAEKFDGMAFVAHTHQYALTRDKNNEIYPLTLNCFEGARKAGIKRAIFGGSVAVYGGTAPPFTEDHQFPPVVKAGNPAEEALMLKFEVSTKRALEMIVLDYGQSFQMGLSVPPGTEKPEPHELEVAGLRAPMMFGPGYQALGSPIGLAVHVAAGKVPHFSGLLGYGGAPIEHFWAGLAAIPTNYVLDNAEAIAVAMTADTLPHMVYNVSSGFPASPRAQFQALLNVAPEAASRFDITPDDLPEPPIDLGFNGDRFAADFGWRSSHTLETAFEDYLGWLKTHPF